MENKEKEIETEIVPRCENCENFMQHYVRSCWFGFSKAGCGHCLKTIQKDRFRKQLTPCKYYKLKDFEEEKQKHEKKIIDYIKHETKTLSQIRSILIDNQDKKTL